MRFAARGGEKASSSGNFVVRAVVRKNHVHDRTGDEDNDRREYDRQPESGGGAICESSFEFDLRSEVLGSPSLWSARGQQFRDPDLGIGIELCATATVEGI